MLPVPHRDGNRRFGFDNKENLSPSCCCSESARSNLLGRSRRAAMNFSSVCCRKDSPAAASKHAKVCDIALLAEPLSDVTHLFRNQVQIPNLANII
jgi:hypothetical protein